MQWSSGPGGDANAWWQHNFLWEQFMNVVVVVSRQLSVIIGYYTEHNYAELGRGKSNSYVNWAAGAD